MKKIVIALLLIIVFVTAAFAVEIEYISPTGVSQRLIAKHLYEAQERQLNMCFNSGALAAATDDVTIASAINYVEDGIFGQIAAGEITMAGATQEVSTTKIYFFSYDTVNATSEITIGAANDTNIENIEIPDGNIPFGYVKVVTSAAVEYVPGTTAWTTSGVTETFYNISIMPFTKKVLNNSR